MRELQSEENFDSGKLGPPQGSPMIETRPDLRRSWYDYSWDWALISLLALVLLAGIVVLWTYADHPQTTDIPVDATTGQSTRPSVPTIPN
jgi:hypothetical protein